MRTLVLGLGNTILSDDGVGIKVIQLLQEKMDVAAGFSPRDGMRRLKPAATVEFKEASIGGLTLLDMIVGYNKVIIIDSIQTKGGKPGKVYKLGPSNFKTPNHLSSPHSVSFIEALELGHKIKLNLPEIINIYAIEVKDNTTFNEKCTHTIQKVIPNIVNKIMHEEFSSA